MKHVERERRNFEEEEEWQKRRNFAEEWQKRREERERARKTKIVPKIPMEEVEISIPYRRPKWVK